MSLTPQQVRDVRAEDLRLARIELRHAAARFGALVNSGRISGTAYSEASDALDAASRTFTNAELRLASAERTLAIIAQQEREALDAERAAKEEAQAKAARRSHLCVIEGGSR